MTTAWAPKAPGLVTCLYCGRGPEDPSSAARHAPDATGAHAPLWSRLPDPDAKVVPAAGRGLAPRKRCVNCGRITGITGATVPDNAVVRCTSHSEGPFCAECYEVHARRTGCGGWSALDDA